MKFVAFLLFFFPLTAFAQPDWYKNSLPNDFENDEVYFFTVTLSENDSKEKVIAKAAMSYKVELNRIIGNYSSFVYKKTLQEGLDLNTGSEENTFLKEVFERGGDYWRGDFPEITKVDVEFHDGKHHAYIQFKVKKNQVTFALKSFIWNYSNEIYFKFKHTHVYNTHFE